MLVISVLFLAWRGNSHMKMTGLLVSLTRRHCTFGLTLAVQDKKPIFLTLNVSLNPLQTDLTLLANNSQQCSTLLEVVPSVCA